MAQSRWVHVSLSSTVSLRAQWLADISVSSRICITAPSLGP